MKKECSADSFLLFNGQTRDTTRRMGKREGPTPVRTREKVHTFFSAGLSGVVGRQKRERRLTNEENQGVSTITKVLSTNVEKGSCGYGRQGNLS